MELELTIRAATAADIPVLRDGAMALAIEAEHTTVDRATVELGLAAAVADRTKARYWVAEADGRVVGMLMVTYEWSDWSNGWVWWLQSVYVFPAYRRRGVMSRLINHARAEARAEGGVVRLRLYVHDTNDRGRATYRALGFQPTAYRVMEGSLEAPGAGEANHG